MVDIHASKDTVLINVDRYFCNLTNESVLKNRNRRHVYLTICVKVHVVTMAALKVVMDNSNRCSVTVLSN